MRCLILMITDCMGLRQWDLSDTETIFVHGVFALVKILIPIALSVYTWKVCRPERDHQRTSMLGLEDAVRNEQLHKREDVQLVAARLHRIKFVLQSVMMCVFSGGRWTTLNLVVRDFDHCAHPGMNAALKTMDADR